MTLFFFSFFFYQVACLQKSYICSYSSPYSPLYTIWWSGALFLMKMPLGNWRRMLMRARSKSSAKSKTDNLVWRERWAVKCTKPGAGLSLKLKFISNHLISPLEKDFPLYLKWKNINKEERQWIWMEEILEMNKWCLWFYWSHCIGVGDLTANG